MDPSESLTVEGVTAATRADAMLLLASQFDEHKVPITGDALDAAVAGLLDDADITVANVELLGLDGGSGNDTLSAGGDASTGAQASFLLRISGGIGSGLP